MKYKITTPDEVTVEVETSPQDPYLKDIEERGYIVERVLNVCTFACEG